MWQDTLPFCSTCKQLSFASAIQYVAKTLTLPYRCDVPNILFGSYTATALQRANCKVCTFNLRDSDQATSADIEAP